MALAGGASLLFQGCVPQPKSETEADSSAPQQKEPTATPHPANEAAAEAVRRHPALSQKDSAFNRKFVALFEAAKAKEPDILTKPDWPLVIAARADAELQKSTAPPPSNVHSTPIAQSGPAQHSGTWMWEKYHGQAGSQPRVTPVDSGEPHSWSRGVGLGGN